MLNVPPAIARAKQVLPNAKHLLLDSPSALFLAIKTGRATAFSIDKPIADYYEAENKDLVRLDVSGTPFDFVFQDSIFLKPGDFKWWLFLDTWVGELRSGFRYEKYVEWYRKWLKKDPPPPATSGTLREIAVLKGSLNGINSLAVSVDGREILTTSWDDTVRIWDVQARETRIVLARSIKAISAAISPDGRWYAAGDYEGMIYLWDSSDPKTKKMPGHTGQLYGLAFTPDSKTLVSSSVDGNVCVWDVLTGLRMRSMNGHPKGALALSMSPDGRTVAVGSGSPMVRTWNIATGEPLKIYESADRGALGWPAYSPDGLKVAFGGNDGRLTIWEPETGTARDLGKHDAGIRAVAWSPDGRTIVTSSADDSLRFWDVASGAYTAQRMSSGYYAVGFSKKGNLLAAGGGDWTLHLFEPSK